MIKKLTLPVVLLVAFAVRLPFLFAGYGMDPDSWRIARVALKWASSGQYEASRLPGYPVPEFFASLIVPQASYWGMNLASALLSLFCLVLAARLFRHYRVPQPMLVTLALAFLPVFFLNSVSGMDFIWSFCFFLGSWNLILMDRTVLAGVALGLAAGSRITYLAAGLPLALMIPHVLWGRWGWWRKAVPFGVITFAVTALCFIPVFKTYGSGFFTYYPSPLNLVELVWKSSIGTFGLLGSLGMSVALIFVRPSRWQMKWQELVPLLLLCGIYALAFFKLPEDSSYLLPLVPPLLILLYKGLTEKMMFAVTVSILLAPFLGHVYKDGFHLRGALLYDHWRRSAAMNYLTHVMENPTVQDANAVVLVGYWEGWLGGLYAERRQSMPSSIRALVTAEELRSLQAEKRRILYLEAQDHYIGRAMGVDLSGFEKFPVPFE